MNLVGRSFARDIFTQALSAEAFVRAMLDFERALASAQGDVGVIPQDAARVINIGKVGMLVNLAVIITIYQPDDAAFTGVFTQRANHIHAYIHLAGGRGSNTSRAWR